jgi:hypothetical protein
MNLRAAHARHDLRECLRLERLRDVRLVAGRERRLAVARRRVRGGRDSRDPAAALSTAVTIAP